MHHCEYKFKNSFQDTRNSMCSCGEDIETLSHYFLLCLNYFQERMTFLNSLSYIDPSILFYLNNAHVT